MKIKMLCSIAGPKMSAKPGDVIEVDAAEGRRHIEAGNAVLPDPLPESPEKKPQKDATK